MKQNKIQLSNLVDIHKVKRNLVGLVHIFQGDVLVTAVEVVATGKQVGARKAFVTKSCSVGSATNWANVRCYTCALHGKFGIVHQVDVWSNLFLHVVVTIHDFYVHCACAMLGVEEVNNLLEKYLFRLELGTVVVADDVLNGVSSEPSYAMLLSLYTITFWFSSGYSA